jgi:hypothetical protein
LNAGIIADAKSPLLKSQFASKSSVKRAGDAGERNGKNAKKQARETVENIFEHFIKICIAVYFRKFRQPNWLVALLLSRDYAQSTFL